MECKEIKCQNYRPRFTVSTITLSENRLNVYLKEIDTLVKCKTFLSAPEMRFKYNDTDKLKVSAWEKI